jgi:DNA-binding SARP family transcriptional activator
MELRFRLLGSVEARFGEKLISIGHAKLRAVLAVLLIDANRVVGIDQLVDRVWGDHRLPQRPRGAVQYCVTMLRKALAPVPEVTITWESSGYQINTKQTAVDLHLFEQLVRRARHAEDDREAEALLERALRLWQGEPFTGLDTPWLATYRATLGLRRHAAQLDLTDIQLRQGKHATVLPELTTRAELEPLDERLAGQLMLALHGSGRSAEALDHYRRLRHRLAEELGTDPCQALALLHQRILAADPGLVAATGTASAPVAGVPVPRQLPARPRLFAGRTAALAHLTAVTNERTRAGDPVVLTVIGSGGIGKSWLALQWAHEQLDLFPDGQLHVNLRGFDPRSEPLRPATVVRGFLDALGISAESVPADQEAQVGLYRSAVAGKRMLIVLDNVRDTDQITPLLPGSLGCVVLATSRHRLDGLVAAHGADTLRLDLLDDTEAEEVLGRHLRGHHAGAEPEAVAELLGYCGGLPLALSIVAARALQHPGFPLSALAAELRDETGRLTALDTGDTCANLGVVLSWSYHALPAPAAVAFGLIGLAPGADIGVPAAVNLLGQPVSTARTLLRQLENAHLVEQFSPGRFRLHDLVRLYAGEQARRDIPEPIRELAMHRLVDFYLHTAHAGDRLLQPLIQPIKLTEPRAGTVPLALSGQEVALTWFATERANLLATQRLATGNGWALRGWQLAWLMTTFLYRQGHFHDALAVWEIGRAAAQDQDDPALYSGTHQLLGAIFAELGRHDEALHHLDLAERSSDLAGEAYTHHALGWSWSLRGDDRRALRHATRALRLYRALGFPAGETRELTVIAWYQARLGDYAGATAHCTAALRLAAVHQLREDEGLATAIMGFITQHTGFPARAVALYRTALIILRQAGNTYYEATVLDLLGETHQALGDLPAARDAWHRALHRCRILGRASDADRIAGHLAALPSNDVGDV